MESKSYHLIIFFNIYLFKMKQHQSGLGSLQSVSPSRTETESEREQQIHEIGHDKASTPGADNTDPVQVDDPKTSHFGSPTLSQRFFQSFKKFHYKDLRGQPIPLQKTLSLFGIDTEPLIRREVNKLKAIRISLVATVLYQSADPDAPPPRAGTEQFLHSRAMKLFKGDDIAERFEVLKNDVIERNTNYVKDKSGLVLYAIVSLDYKISKYAPLAAAGYKPLPVKLANKKAIINVQNSDNRCFAYALCAALHQVRRDAERPNQYTEYFPKHELDKLEYPIEPALIPQLEKKLKLRLNVFCFDDEDGLEPYPYFVSRRPECEPEVDLLYFDKHFAWIKNFSRFASGVSKHHGDRFFCKRCMGHFRLEHALQEHKRICTREDFNSVIWTMPPPGSEIKFHHYKHQGHAPFVIYADFEAYLQNLLQPDESEESKGVRPTTIRSTIHKPIAIGSLIVAGKPIFEPQEGFSTGLQRSEYFCSMGEDATTDFLNKLIEWEAFCLAEMEKNHPFLGRAPWRYAQAQDCYLCHKEFVKDDPIMRRVVDHDHFTGQFLGAAHAFCNLQRRKSFKIPVFFHNFRGYDSHFIVRAFHLYPERKINVIAQTMEKYLQVEWGERIVFRDSLQFLSASLDNLIKSLNSSKGKFHLLRHPPSTTVQSSPVWSR